VLQELSGGARMHSALRHGDDGLQPIIEVNELKVKRGIRTVLEGLSFNMKKGQVTILEAPNGWGKSTLLDSIVGIEPVQAGTIKLKGDDIADLETHARIRKGMTYLRSNQKAFPSLTVNQHTRLVSQSATVFDCAVDREAKAQSLSGGETQKLLLHLLHDSDIYLLDEPFIGLDAASTNILVKKLNKLHIQDHAILITIPTTRSH
jgi:ABC-type multidrug transport system ATPase subunit